MLVSIAEREQFLLCRFANYCHFYNRWKLVICNIKLLWCETIFFYFQFFLKKLFIYSLAVVNGLLLVN